MKRYHQETMWAYINGRLSTEQIDELWAEILQHPYLWEYLSILIMLKRHFSKYAKRRLAINT